MGEMVQFPHPGAVPGLRHRAGSTTCTRTYTHEHVWANPSQLPSASATPHDGAQVLSAFINAMMSILGDITPPFTCDSNPSLANTIQVDGSMSTPCGSDYVGAPACGAPFTITYACPRDVHGCLTTTAATCKAGYVSEAQNSRSSIASNTVAFLALSSPLANACRCYAGQNGMTYTDPSLSAARCPICKPGYAKLGPRGCGIGVAPYVQPAILGGIPMCTCGMASPCPAGYVADPGNCLVCKTCSALCCSQRHPNRCSVCMRVCVWGGGGLYLLPVRLQDVRCALLQPEEPQQDRTFTHSN